MSDSPAVPEMKTGLTWQDFGDFDVVSTTTSKLATTLGEIDFENHLVRNGDAEPREVDHKNPSRLPAPAYQHVLQVTHTGGRDWAIIVGLDYPQF